MTHKDWLKPVGNQEGALNVGREGMGLEGILYMISERSDHCDKGKVKERMQ